VFYQQDKLKTGCCPSFLYRAFFPDKRTTVLKVYYFMGYLEGCKQTSLLLDSTFSTFITSDLNGKKLFYFFSGECAYSVTRRTTSLKIKLDYMWPFD